MGKYLIKFFPTRKLDKNSDKKEMFDPNKVVNGDSLSGARQECYKVDES